VLDTMTGYCPDCGAEMADLGEYGWHCFECMLAWLDITQDSGK